MEKTYLLKMPMMPNFIKVGEFDNHIPIESLSKDEAIKYGQEMSIAFYEHWEKKVNEKADQKECPHVI